MDNPEDNFASEDTIDDNYQENIHATISAVLENSFDEESQSSNTPETSVAATSNDATVDSGKEPLSRDGENADTLAVEADNHVVNADNHAVKADDHVVNADNHAVTADDHVVNADNHAVKADDHVVNAYDHAVETDGNDVKLDDQAVCGNDHAVETADCALNAEDHVVEADDNDVKADDEAMNADDNAVETDGHAVEVDDHVVETDDHAVETDDLAVNANDQVSNIDNQLENADCDAKNVEEDGDKRESPKDPLLMEVEEPLPRSDNESCSQDESLDANSPSSMLVDEQPSTLDASSSKETQISTKEVTEPSTFVVCGEEGSGPRPPPFDGSEDCDAPVENQQDEAPCEKVFNNESTRDTSNTSPLVSIEKRTRATYEPSNSCGAEEATEPEEDSHLPLKKRRTESPTKAVDTEVMDNPDNVETFFIKKHLRTPTKTVQYTESSSPEKPSDEDLVPVNYNQKQERSPSHTLAETDDGDASFFVPEGWIFYGTQRLSGPSAGAYDMYYLTPHPRKKLRSRKELKDYMSAHGLNYDPLRFFVRNRIDSLLKKGVLKLLDSGHIVLSSAEESHVTSALSSEHKDLFPGYLPKARRVLDKKSSGSKEIADVEKRPQRKRPSHDEGGNASFSGKDLSNDHKSAKQKRSSLKEDPMPKNVINENKEQAIPLLHTGNEAPVNVPNEKKKRGRPPLNKKTGALSGNNTNQRKKMGRPPSRNKVGSIINASTEKQIQGRHSSSSEKQVPANAFSDKKKQGRLILENENCESVGAPKERKTQETSQAYGKEEIAPDLSSEKKTMGRLSAHASSKSNEGMTSIFVPEGWFFHAHKRKTTAAADPKYDMYYVTPPPHVKLRSRKELANYMAAHGLDYDPTLFFNKTVIDPLLESGVLKILDTGHIVFSNVDDADAATLLRLKPTIKTETSVESLPVQTKQATVLKSGLKRTSATSSSAMTSSATNSSPAIKSSQTASKKNSERSSEKETIPPKKPGRPGRPRKSVAVPETESPMQTASILGEKMDTRSKGVKKSPYFSSNGSGMEKPKALENFRLRTINDPPPRSPYNLIQEDLFHDPWQLLIATIFLNSTSGRLAVPLALEFLKRWPTPELARQAKIDDILDIIQPLGFGRTRAAIILRFSHEYLTKVWRLPSELYGIGEYGNDSYKIFCLRNAWKTVESDDPMLIMYLNWRRATEHLRKRFMRTSKKSSRGPHGLNSNKKASEVSQSTQQKVSTRKRTRTAPK